MRVTIAHRKTKQAAIDAVDRAMQDAFQLLAVGPIAMTNPQKAWNGSVMTFSVTARMGLLQNPIKGTAEVTDTDITIDMDLGLLGKLIPEERVRTSVESGVRGLLT